MKALACLACCVSVAALAVAQDNQKSTTPVRPLPPADLAAIRSEHEAYRRNVIDGAWAKWAGHFTADAIMMPPHAPAVTGPANIEAWGRTLPHVVDFQNPIAEIEGAGDVAMMRGHFTLVFSMPGQPDQSDVGKFMVTWRRQATGAWKFHRGIFNSDLPSPPAAYVGIVPGANTSGVRAADPWLGTWVLNVAKTRINPGPKPRSETRSYTATADGEHATYDTVESDGKKIFSTSTYKFDGQDSKIVGDPDSHTQAIRRTSPRSIASVIKKDGKVVRTATREASPDGQTLTVEFKGTNAKGQPIIEEVWVFDRQSGGASSDATIAEVKAAVQTHWNAINGKDSATVNRQHTTDHSLILADLESRMVLNSPASLAQLRKWEGSKVDWNIRDLEVQPLGNAAVASFYLDGSIQWPDGTVDSRPRRVTEVWVNDRGTWKEAHHHDSVFSAMVPNPNASLQRSR